MPGLTEPQPMSTADYAGDWVVPVFYPRDFTLVCPTELRGFADLAGEFARGRPHRGREHGLLLGAQGVVRGHAHPAGGSYPVIADPAHRLAQAYGILLEDGSAMRATYIIDPAGTVRNATVSDPSVGRSPAETLRVLHALQTRELCPVDWTPGLPTLSIAA